MWVFLRKLELDVPRDPAVPLLGYTQGIAFLTAQTHVHPWSVNSLHVHSAKEWLVKCGTFTQWNVIQLERKLTS